MGAEEENAARARAWTEAFNRDEFDALAEFADPAIEWVVAREHPEATTHVGVEAVATLSTFATAGRCV